jgi:hypothetical protein
LVVRINCTVVIFSMVGGWWKCNFCWCIFSLGHSGVRVVSGTCAERLLFWLAKSVVRHWEILHISCLFSSVLVKRYTTLKDEEDTRVKLFIS